MTNDSLIDYKLFEPTHWQAAMEHVGLPEYKGMADFEKKAASV